MKTPRAKKPERKTGGPAIKAAASGSPVPAPQCPHREDLLERVRQLVRMPLAWDDNVVLLGVGEAIRVDEQGNRQSLKAVGQPSLEDLLRDPTRSGEAWREVLPILRKWMLQHKSEVGDLFHKPYDYPAFIVWIGLCVFKFESERAELVYQFLMERVFKSVAWRGSKLTKTYGSKVFREHLGYSDKTDQSSLAREIKRPALDIDQDLYEHFVTEVLQDVRMVNTDVHGYLRTAAQNFLRDLHDKAHADFRPALVLSTLQPDNEGDFSTGDEELSTLAAMDNRISEAADSAGVTEQEAEKPKRPRYRERDHRVADGALAVGEVAELDDLLIRAKLNPSEWELATLIRQGYKPAEAAEKMEVSRQRVNALLRSMKKKLHAEAGAPAR